MPCVPPLPAAPRSSTRRSPTCRRRRRSSRQAVRSVKIAMIGQPRALLCRSRKLVALADVGKHPVELLAATLAARGLVLLMENALAGDGDRLGDRRVQVLGELAGRLLRTGIGDRDHIDAYIYPPGSWSRLPHHCRMR